MDLHYRSRINLEKRVREPASCYSNVSLNLHRSGIRSPSACLQLRPAGVILMKTSRHRINMQTHASHPPFGLITSWSKPEGCRIHDPQSAPFLGGGVLAPYNIHRHACVPYQTEYRSVQSFLHGCTQQTDRLSSAVCIGTAGVQHCQRCYSAG